MKFNDPFGLSGSLEVDGSFKIGKQSGKFSASSGDFVASVPIPWAPGEIHVVVDVEYELAKVGGVDFWDLQMVYAGTGNFGVAADWRIIVTDDEMELKPIGAGPSGQPKGKNDIKVAVGNALLTESSPREKKYFVKFAVTLVAGLESKGIGVGYGGVSGTLGGGATTGDTKVITFTINLEVEKPVKKVPKPIPKIPNGLLRPEPILYSEDEDYLPSKAVGELRKWANGVKDIPEFANLIIGGLVPIKLEAFASTTGNPQQNKKETDKRLDQARKVIKEEFKGMTRFDEKSWGDKKADGKGPKNPRNRRVEIELDGTAVNKLLQAMSGG